MSTDLKSWAKVRFASATPPNTTFLWPDLYEPDVTGSLESKKARMEQVLEKITYLATVAGSGTKRMAETEGRLSEVTVERRSDLLHALNKIELILISEAEDLEKELDSLGLLP